MNEHIHTLAEEVALYYVNNLVAVQKRHFGRHLDVYGGELSSGTVVVYHQIMSTENSVVGQYFFTNALNKLSARSFAEKRVERVSYQAYSAVQDKHRDCCAHNTVQLYGAEMRYHQRREHRRCGDYVVAAVGSGGG